MRVDGNVHIEENALPVLEVKRMLRVYNVALFPTCSLPTVIAFEPNVACSSKILTRLMLNIHFAPVELVKTFRCLVVSIFF